MVEGNVAAAIVGGFAIRVDMSELQKFVEKIRYPGVKLKYLRGVWR